VTPDLEGGGVLMCSHHCNTTVTHKAAILGSLHPFASETVLYQHFRRLSEQPVHVLSWCPGCIQ
jgi:hypothetical protein